MLDKSNKVNTHIQTVDLSLRIKESTTDTAYIVIYIG